MKSVVQACVLAALVTVALPSVHAEDVKIAVVKVSKVFKEYTKVKDVQGQMEALFKPKSEEIRDKLNKLKTASEAAMAQMQAQGDDPRTKPEALKVIHGFQVRELELKSEAAKLSEEMNKEELSRMKQVLIDIRSAIREVAKAEGVDLVLRASEFDYLFTEGAPTEEKKDEMVGEPRTSLDLVRAFRENPVIQYHPRLDITDKVIQMLNAK
jgi:Skp family chaperone for outer membrane proteins